MNYSIDYLATLNDKSNHAMAVNKKSSKKEYWFWRLKPIGKFAATQTAKRPQLNLNFKVVIFS